LKSRSGHARVAPGRHRKNRGNSREIPRRRTGLNDSQLDTPYRDGGWTVRQVVHHVPDSHVNAYVRLKLALTESSPQ